MKKAVLFLLCAALLLGVACIRITVNPNACGGEEQPPLPDVTPEPIAAATASAPVPAADTPAPEPTAPPTEPPYEPDLSMLPWQHYVDWNATEETWLTVDLDYDGHAETFSIRINQDFETSTILVDGNPALENVYHGRYIDHVIFADLDPDTPYANFMYVIDWGSMDYITYVLHLENGKLVQDLEYDYGVFLTDDGMLEEWIQNDLLGTKFCTRQVAGEDLKPYSEWMDCREATKNDWTVDRQDNIENGFLLHASRDIECTVDGQKSFIKTGSYFYMVRCNDSYTLAEVCTEDGTHALIPVELLQEGFGFTYLLAGVPQDDCIDNIGYAD